MSGTGSLVPIVIPAQNPLITQKIDSQSHSTLIQAILWYGEIEFKLSSCTAMFQKNKCAIFILMAVVVTTVVH